MYCLCVNVYCHRVSTQLQLTISISINSPDKIGHKCCKSVPIFGMFTRKTRLDLLNEHTCCDLHTISIIQETKKCGVFFAAPNCPEIDACASFSSCRRYYDRYITFPMLKVPTMLCSASSFNFDCLFLSFWLSCSCLRLLPSLPVPPHSLNNGMGLMRIKTLVNVARMMITKGSMKGDVQSHALAVTQVEFQYRTWPCQRPSSVTSETQTRGI
jgi:hypothetical protein